MIRSSRTLVARGIAASTAAAVTTSRRRLIIPIEIMGGIASSTFTVFGIAIGYLMATNTYDERLQQYVETHNQKLQTTMDTYTIKLNKETELRCDAQGRLKGLESELDKLKSQQRVADTGAGSLLKALTVPNVSGRWGELSLRRIVELSGMMSYVDFAEQQTMEKDGETYRADMVIHFHGKRYLVVDSKAPMAAFEETLLAGTEKEEKVKLRKYTNAIRKHVGELSTKKYWSSVNGTSPEFVVAFLASEAFYCTALKEDPDLIEYCLEKKVVLASPVTLIALLKVIEFGWRQEDAERNVEDIKNLMREQYSRTLAFSDHFSALGKGLQNAVKKYNDAVGSFESRLLPSTRKMKEMGAIVGEDIPESQPMSLPVRTHAPVGDEVSR